MYLVCKRKQKKKNGNVILMVLMVATVLIILSAVVSSALVFTTKGNTVVKYKNDYLYAAEGGIEQGLEHYKSKGLSFVDFDIPYLVTSSENPSKGIEKVHVSLDKSDRNNLRVVSTVTANGEEVAKIVLPVGKMVGISNILKYSLAASDKVDVHAAGAIDFNTVNIGANNKDDCTVKQNGGTDANRVVSETEMNEPVFNRTQVPNKHVFPRKFTSFTDFKSYIVTNGKNLNTAMVPLTNGIGYYNVPREGNSNEYMIIFVDSNNFEIEATDAITMENIILICSGEIKFKTNANFNFNRSTIYSPKISINLGGAYNQSNAPLYNSTAVATEKDLPGDKAIFINGNVTTNQIKKFDSIISKYMDSYGADSEVSGDLEIDYGNAEYIY